MSDVPGTQGYEKVVAAFAQDSHGLNFDEINHDFLPLLPPAPARILDAGAGVGQNAAALIRRGYKVVAVEPLLEFIADAKATYQTLSVDWRQDSLPGLKSIDTIEPAFDFILLDGIWHHLRPEERPQAIERLANLLSSGGICAISLRNGPAGAGTHLFPTCCDELASLARQCGLEIVLRLEQQASKLKNRPDVIWARMALRKPV